MSLLDEPGMDLLCAAIATLLFVRWRIWSRSWTALAIAGAAVATTLLVLTGTSPAFDDYSYAVAGRSGWAAFQLAHYQEWTGRFLATAAISGWPQILPLDAAYPVMAEIIWLASVAAVCWCAWLLLPAAWPGRLRTVMVSWGVLGWVAGYPSFADGVAWLPGAISYLLPVGLLAGGCALLLTPSPRLSWWRACIAVLSIAASCGGSEMNTLATGLLVGGLGLRSWLRQDDRRWVWSIALAGALVAGGVSAAAPGHMLRRAASFADGRARPELLQAVGMGVEGAIAAVVQAIRHPAIWGAWLLMAGLAAGRTAVPCPRWLPWSALAAVPLVHILIEFPILYGQGMGAPGRGQNLLWTAMWACLSVGAVSAGLVWGAAATGSARRLRNRVLWLLSQGTRDGGRRMAIAVLGCCVLTVPFLGAQIEVATVAAVTVCAGGLAVVAFRTERRSTCERRAQLCDLTGRGLVIVTLAGALVWGAWSRMLADLPLLPAHVAALIERRRLVAAARPDDIVLLPMWDPQRTPRSIVAYDMTASVTDNAAQAAWYRVRGIIVGPRGHLQHQEPP